MCNFHEAMMVGTAEVGACRHAIVYESEGASHGALGKLSLV